MALTKARLLKHDLPVHGIHSTCNLADFRVENGRMLFRECSSPPSCHELLSRGTLEKLYRCILSLGGFLMGLVQIGSEEVSLFLSY